MKTIPKICHLYWDKSPMAFLQVITVLSFHRCNPDWKIIVYLSKQGYEELGKTVYDRKYVGKDYFACIRRLDYVEIKEIDLVKVGVPLTLHSCQGSDIVRRHLLYHFGGVYSDFDTIWLKPMLDFEKIDCIGDPSDFESIVSFFGFTKGFHNVSNLISEPGSQYIWSLIEEEKKIKPPYEHQSFGSDIVTRLYPDLTSVLNKFPRIVAIKYYTFYPYSIYDLDQLYQKSVLYPIKNKNVMCIHWFNGHELSTEYLNDKNQFRRKCSMTSILWQEGYI